VGETITPKTSKIEVLEERAAAAVELLPGSVKRVTGRDLLAGFTNAIANVPDCMANATLAGLNPIHGLYSLVIGTPVAALTTSSKLMTVAVTGSMALIVADALSAVPADQRAVALISLTLLVGVVQILLGAFRAGTLVRFVSNSVMRGFLTGVAVNIVLSQIADVTGYKSDFANKSLRLLDVALHPQALSPPTMAIAVLTVAIILGVGRTRIATFAFPIALIVSTLVVRFASVAVVLVGDSAVIPSALPKLVLPTVSGLLTFVVPAVSVAIVGLIQGAGISKAVPNPGGEYSNINRDFIGQGAGNAAASLFGGMPVGASLSSTALNVQLGGRHRVANFMIGPIVALVLLLLAPAVELIPRAALGAMLIVIGVRAIDVPAIRSVWQTSVQTRTIMVVTFIGTLIIPVQFAVLVGVALSVVQYTFSSSLDARVVTLSRDDEGRVIEGEPPAKLPDDAVTVLDVYGSVFYAGTDVIDRLLPDAIGAQNAVAVLRLRGRADVGSTFLQLIRRYSEQVAEGGGYLALVGIGPALLDQLERTGAADVVGRDHIYLAKPALLASLEEAVSDAQSWLESRSGDA
jgi:SulP family sulfate permease